MLHYQKLQGKKKQIQAQDVVDAALSKVVVENKEKY